MTLSPKRLPRRSIFTTSSPERAQGGNSNSSVLRRLGGSTFSILSSFLTRDCTCDALAAWALKRSMKRISLASIACWRCVGGLGLRLVQRALALVEIVVARVAGQHAAVDLDDAPDDAVHELAIVRGHQQRALVRLEEALQPDERLDVEVVGRLVEQHGVGPHQQDARQRDAHLPPARQRARRRRPSSPARSRGRPGSRAPAPRARSRPARRSAPAPRRSARAARPSRRRAPDRPAPAPAASARRRPSDTAPAPSMTSATTGRPGHLAHVLAEVADGDAAIDRDLARRRATLPS